MANPRIETMEVSAYTVPTDEPEADGTLGWDSTPLVVVRVTAGGTSGLGYTYADRAAAALVDSLLKEVVADRDAMDVGGAWHAMKHRIRNQGQAGVAAMAISAVDVALWDLKARLLDLPLATLLGRVRDAVPIYGSGGFTSYTVERLQTQLRAWTGAGIPRVKMKVGQRPSEDMERVRAARDAIGADAELFVDGNGAYDRKQALAYAEGYRELGVGWFEEPVPASDLEGLRFLRDRVPAGMEVSAGEYGYTLPDFLRLLREGAVDVLQADVTRCGGFTAFLKVGALCEAFGTPLSAHTAPALSLHAGVAVESVRHIEYFHDHVRIEQLLFDGILEPRQGSLAPDPSRTGHGLEFKRQDAQAYLVWGPA